MAIVLADEQDYASRTLTDVGPSDTWGRGSWLRLRPCSHLRDLIDFQSGIVTLPKAAFFNRLPE
jgi:hypothetical protein